MEHKLEEIKNLLQDAEMILVGIGKEFTPVFETAEENEALFPYLKSRFYKNLPQDHEIIRAYDRLRELIGVKPYFVVNLNTDDLIYRSAMEQDLVVCPCGSMSKMQCGEHIVDAEPAISAVLGQNDTETAAAAVPEHNAAEASAAVVSGQDNTDSASEVYKLQDAQPLCPVCGAPLHFHTIETEGYLESGYLPQWNHYNRWLSCTLNRKLVLLELGAGFEYPQVIRWPFEKVTLYNRKSHLIRVGTRFPQIPEEISERGISIAQSPVQFLLNF